MLELSQSVPGTIEWYAPNRPTSATVVIRDASGVVVASTPATVDTVATTLTEGVAAGATLVKVVSAAGIAADRLYRLGGDAPELVEVEDIDVLDLHLKHPTSETHAVGDAFEGTRISYSYTPPTIGDAFQATFSWLVGATAQQPEPIEFRVVTREVSNPASDTDVYRIVPNLHLWIPEGWDLSEAREDAFEEVKAMISARGVPLSDYRGTRGLRLAVAYGTAALAYETAGQAYLPTVEAFRARRDNFLDLYVRTTAADAVRDDAIEDVERVGRTGTQEVDQRAGNTSQRPGGTF